MLLAAIHDAVARTQAWTNELMSSSRTSHNMDGTGGHGNGLQIPCRLIILIKSCLMTDDKNLSGCSQHTAPLHHCPISIGHMLHALVFKGEPASICTRRA